MKEYRFVQIHDDSSQDDRRLEEFIDKLSERERSRLYSAHQHGGGVTLIWNSYVPKNWEGRNEIDVDFSGGSDHWILESSVQDPPKLPASLAQCLDVLRRLKDNRQKHLQPEERALLTPRNYRALESWGMIELESELALVTPETVYDNPARLMFMETVKDYDVTDRGRQYSHQ